MLAADILHKHEHATVASLVLLLLCLRYGHGCSTLRTSGGTQRPENCIFPFIYKGIRYTWCTRDHDGDNRLWCSVETDSEGNHVTGQRRWGHCDLEACQRDRPGPTPPSPRTTTSNPPALGASTNIDDNGQACNTISGNKPDLPCKFPFSFRGKRHTSCTREGAGPENIPWCSTRVNDRGVHIKGNWGNCDCASDCIVNTTRLTYDITADGTSLPDSCALDSPDFIVGGENASVNEFPFAALLGLKQLGQTVYFCGGSLINRRYVLTAAHCADQYKPTEVLLGELDLGETCDCTEGICAHPVQKFGVAEITLHEDWASGLQGNHYNLNDIALIRLDGLATIRRNVRPVCLPANDHDDRTKSARVIGWGRTFFNDHGDLFKFGASSRILQRLSIPMKTERECKEVVNTEYKFQYQTRRQLCGGERGKDTCRGDSGGALLFISKSRYVQLGITSYGSKICGSGKPAVYTRVSAYMGWIRGNLKP